MVLEAAQLDDVSLHPAELAPFHYARGELQRRKAEALPLGLPEADFGAVLEERCALLLAAQSAYSDAMRSRDPRWSTMAGYRVGELYERLHAAVLTAPRPAQLPSALTQQLFEGALRLRFKVLLEKGLKVMGSTRQLVDRVGESSTWAEKVLTAEAALAQRLADEQRALEALPFTEAQLRGALDELGGRRARPPARR
jgi:hypothetical protein